MKGTGLLKYPVLLCLLLGWAGFSASGQKVRKMEKVKTAKVAHVVFSNSVPDMAEIESKFSSLKSNSVDVVNWPDRNGSYSPEASFKIMYSDTDLYIRYQVKETEIRSTFGADSGSRPWTDDCMELFIAPVNETGVYFNIEMNCTGHGIVGYGDSKKDRGHFEKERMDRIRRFSTLGSEAFGDRLSEKPVSWSMIIVIPLDLILQGRSVSSIKGTTVRGNVFKCGDEMKNRHYLTWNPVGTPKPDYHRPEFFGYFQFE